MPHVYFHPALSVHPRLDRRGSPSSRLTFPFPFSTNPSISHQVRARDPAPRFRLLSPGRPPAAETRPRRSPRPPPAEPLPGAADMFAPLPSRRPRHPRTRLVPLLEGRADSSRGLCGVLRVPGALWLGPPALRCAARRGAASAASRVRQSPPREQRARGCPFVCTRS